MLADQNIIKTLKGNGVVVMPTDTIYGLVGSALDVSVVNRIHNIRKRAPEKPCIILIGDMSELHKFSVSLSAEQKEKIKEYWPDSVSIVLDCLDNKFLYLHRGTNTLAFRLPNDMQFRKFLLETGPLIAPSANIEGFPPAQNVVEAQKYFGDSVDMYIDGGEINGKPSRLIKLKNDGSIEVLRY